MSAWRPDWPGPLPTSISSAAGRRQVEQFGGDEPVVDDDLRRAQEFGAPQGEQARVAGAGADQGHRHRRGLHGPRSAPPASSSRYRATARPSGGPVDPGRLVAQDDVAVGTGQHPVEPQARSAGCRRRRARRGPRPAACTHRPARPGRPARPPPPCARAASSMAARAPSGRRGRRSRHSTASAPWATWGSIVAGSSVSTPVPAGRLPSEPVERGRRPPPRRSRPRPPGTGGWPGCPAGR